ncbi:NlpC/P60 family protein [Tropicimonas isoalkanivorans]|uniref:Putative phage cell wall peptidase, NlpC/P60 family n=1 Tax=Tropicimonas isoalkanivorans TaxID=441112 RepID=A0A1I1E857_9RHOB|nr:NlpC/P60 family protein [Tropicimonas isoalkanivorans]SFB83349.1 putative phage cell wall peptidase, NlpC/P60 family [Tropicimonas isoalkanivorans]
MAEKSQGLPSQPADPARVVEIARRWIGTPYCHQASIPGVGTDCLGLIRGIWRELLGREPVFVPPYSPDWSEASGDERQRRAAECYLLPAASNAQPEPGDMILFRMRDGRVAKHLGVAAERSGSPSFIHAYSGHSVVESALTDAWRKRIVARFVFPQGVR